MGLVEWMLGLSIIIGSVAILIGGVHFLVLWFALSRSIFSPVVLSSGLRVLGLVFNLAAALVGVDERRRPAVTLILGAIVINSLYIVFWVVRLMI